MAENNKCEMCGCILFRCVDCGFVICSKCLDELPDKTKCPRCGTGEKNHAG